MGGWALVLERALSVGEGSKRVEGAARCGRQRGHLGAKRELLGGGR